MACLLTCREMLLLQIDRPQRSQRLTRKDSPCQVDLEGCHVHRAAAATPTFCRKRPAGLHTSADRCGCCYEDVLNMSRGQNAARESQEGMHVLHAVPAGQRHSSDRRL